MSPPLYPSFLDFDQSINGACRFQYCYIRQLELHLKRTYYILNTLLIWVSTLIRKQNQLGCKKKKKRAKARALAGPTDIG